MDIEYRGGVLDGVSIAGFEGFTLALGDRTYTTQNGNDVWPVSGTWDFKANSLTILTRDDGVEMTLSIISDNEITISFAYTDGPSGGRYSGVSEDYEFNLKK